MIYHPFRHLGLKALSVGIAVLLWLTVAVPGGQAAQRPVPRVTRAVLAEVAAQAREPGALREVTIRWTAYAGATKTLVPSAQAVAVNRLELLAERLVSGSLPHDRQPDFSGDQVLVVATDGAGATLSWQLLPDPRILLYTGYSDPISADECRDCDVIEVLHKPLDHAALHRLLRANLPS